MRGNVYMLAVCSSTGIPPIKIRPSLSKFYLERLMTLASCKLVLIPR
jgi:hypothetical protein